MFMSQVSGGRHLSAEALGFDEAASMLEAWKAGRDGLKHEDDEAAMAVVQDALQAWRVFS